MRIGFGIALAVVAVLAVSPAGPFESPMRWLVFAAAMALGAIGFEWMRRITDHGDGEESYDRHWRSRQHVPASVREFFRPTIPDEFPTVDDDDEGRVPPYVWIHTLRTIANIGVGAVLVLTFWVGPSAFDPMSDDAVNFAGLPANLVVIAVGLAMAIGGRIWLELIVRENWEPDAYDRHWWSRA